MKVEHRIILLSVVVGFLAGLVESVVDFLFFYGDVSFWDLALFRIPVFEFWLRSLLLLTSVGFGVIISRLFSQRRQAEEALRESEEKYRALVEDTNDIPHSLDLKGAITYIGPQVSRYGFSPEEMVSKNFLQFIFPDDRETLLSLFKKTMETGEEVGARFRIEDKEGHIHWLDERAKVQRDGSGKVVGLRGILRDVTERKQAEEKLKESEERLKVMFDSVPMGIAIIDTETHKIVDFNPVAVKMVDIPKEEILGHVCHKYICPAERGTCPITDLGQKVDNSERVLLTRGLEIPILKTVVPIVLDGRKCLLEGFVDITERKKGEEALEMSNRMKGLFIDIMQHDLLGPIGNVKNLLDIAIKEKDEAERNEALEYASMNVERMISFMEDVSTISKIEDRGEIETSRLDLAKALGDAIDGLKDAAGERGIEIENRATGGYPVEANPLIGNVFSNLVSNAIKYSPEGSRIVLDIEDSGALWKVSVTDFGDGIPDKYKQTIFERFTRRAKEGVKGSGLGLAIVKRIVELHSGRVWVEDNPKGGSIFYVEIPKERKRLE